jgi:hypothetical protein
MYCETEPMRREGLFTMRAQVREGNVSKILGCGLVLMLASGAALAQSYEFRSSWKAQDIQKLDMAGKKVAAVVVSSDESLRMSAEEAMARELNSRGFVGVAGYRSIPAELLQDGDKAHAWFEKTGVSGVVILRLLSVDKERVASAVVWTSTSYQSFDNYYATAWHTVTPIGRGREVTSIAVETTLFDVAKGGLIWGGVTETRDVKNVQAYVAGLAGAISEELQRTGLVTRPR